MAEREAIYKLKFAVDKSAQQESVRAIDALADEFADLDKNAQMVSRSAQATISKLAGFERGRKELRATADEAKQVAIQSDAMGQAIDRGVDKLRATADEAKRAAIETEDLGDAMAKTAQEVDKTTQSVNTLSGRLDQADENFDVVSRRVGLAGDVQSNLGATRGLADFAGLGGVGQGIGIAGEFAALTEELPRFKAAIQNMPDVLKFAASEIGAPGLGLIGALGALSVALALASSATQKEKDLKLAELAAAEQFSVFSTTATFDEAVAKRKEIETEIKRQQERLISVQKQLGESDKALRENAQKNIGGIFGDSAVTDALSKGFASATQGLSDIGIGHGDIQGLEAESDRLNKSLHENIEFFNLLSEGLVYGTFAADDATKAIETQGQATVAFYQKQYELQLEYQDLVAHGSKEELDQLLAQNSAEMDANRERVNGLFTVIDTYKKEGREVPVALQSAFDEAIKTTNDLNAAQVYLTNTAQPLIEARETEARVIAQTTSVLGEVAGKIAAASTEQQKITSERVAALKEQARQELEFSRFLKGATLENVTARAEALQEEAAALRSILPELEALAPSSKAAADELAATKERLGEISEALAQLGSEGVLAAIQREQAELTAEITKIEAARDERIAQLRAQAAQKEIELYQDLQQDIANAIADANEERADAQREYQEEAAQIERDLARKRLDIEKKYSRDAANAVGDRDALALYQAKQTRNEQLEDAEESAQQAREDLQRNYAQQLETINRELTKQQQMLQQKYQQQLADLRAQTANSINLERQKAAQEIAARQQAYQEQLAQLNDFAQGGVASIASFATTSLGTLSNFVQQAHSIMAGLLGGATNTPTTPTPIPTPVPIPPPTPVPTPPPTAPNAPGTFRGEPRRAQSGININIAGYTAAQIQAELNGVLKLMIPN